MVALSIVRAGAGCCAGLGKGGVGYCSSMQHPDALLHRHAIREKKKKNPASRQDKHICKSESGEEPKDKKASCPMSSFPQGLRFAVVVKSISNDAQSPRHKAQSLGNAQTTKCSFQRQQRFCFYLEPCLIRKDIMQLKHNMQQLAA